MPCGGVYPVENPKNAWCWMCGSKTCDNKPEGPWSFVEEWDALIHDRCIDDFLKTDDGKVVLSHNHEIVRRTTK
jgi:hypothetical protein